MNTVAPDSVARSAASPAPTSNLPSAGVAPTQRLVSLDALRGFDMFWILGGDALIHALAAMTKSGPMKAVEGQFLHNDWAGFAFYDLIFPLFVFIVGASSVFSLTRLVEREGRAAAVKRVLRRGALIFLLGIFYSGGVTNLWPDIRLLGVLQRIALAYTATGLLFCFFKPRALAIIGTAILVGYWGLLTFVPIRDVQLERNALPAQMGVAKPTLVEAHAFYDGTTKWITGGYDAGRNLSNHLDFNYLPGRKYDLYWDPEGLLSTLPAVATCLMGVFAGLLLRRSDVDGLKKTAWLAAAGVAAVALGCLWGLQFPIVKKIWTSSFVLVAGGSSLLLLSAFYYMIDVRQWRGWCQPFIWVGMNAITLYLASNLLGFRRIAPRLAGGNVKAFFDGIVPQAGDVVLALTALALMLWLGRFLYRRQIFLRL